MIDVEVRPAAPGDLNFILNSWCRSYRDSGFARHIPTAIYFRFQHLVVEQIIKRQESRLLVAHPQGDTATILGWICWEGQPSGRQVVHMAYVKASWRSLGIFRRLLTAAGINDPALVDFTHLTPDCRPDPKHGREGLQAKWPQANYVPWLI
jgi:hypothetical protein